MSDFLGPAKVTKAGLDADVTAKLNDTGSAARGALNATFVPKWKATTAYTAGDKVVNPSGDVVSAISTFTSGASYNAANWALPTTYVRFVDLAGNPISARHVTIKVDTSTWEIADIVAEA
jgi:hypothetical protein